MGILSEAKHILQDNILPAILVLVIFFAARCIAIALKPGLRSLPGPNIARFTPFYRAWRISKGDAPVFYRNLHDKYGPIIRTGPSTVDISDPSTLPIIYGIGSKFLKSAFYDVFSPYFEDKVMPSMFTVRDPIAHQALRRPVAQKFSMSSINSLEPFADECTGIFIDAMRDLEGQQIDLGAWLQWYAFDVIGAITFQRRLDLWKSERMYKWAGSWATYWGSCWPGSLASFLDDWKSLGGKFTQKCIDDYDRQPTQQHCNRPDFLAWLRSEETKGKPMSNRDIMNHLSNNLLAGSDTTAISLRAIIYFLVQNEPVYKRLQEEIDEANAAGRLSDYITYAECLELPYFDRQVVMKEAMRCHPGVSFPLERVIPESGAVLCGVQLEAGTIVGINPAVIHHDKSIFGEDAAVFRPERWLESSEEEVKRMDRHLMTFGYGSRTCIGKNISIMEMGKLVPQLIRHFEIEWASEDPEWKVETFWFAKQHGLKCRFRCRTSVT
ncbi:cytochrome P450 [Penicillium sp. IBT 35674x]|nr:cytochrome P450 [Penicillium sp. IBT 35674x]